MQDHITLIGNLGSKPELKTTSAGQMVANFRIATNSRRLNRASNTWEDVDPNWYDVAAWGDLAAHAASSLEKGQRVIVVGKVRMRSFDTQNGQRTKHEVVADALGHDLSAGSATFTRRQRPPAESWPARETVEVNTGELDAPPDPDTRSSSAQEWHVPPVDAEVAVSPPF